jgi:hypothetical protein
MEKNAKSLSSSSSSSSSSYSLLTPVMELSTPPKPSNLQGREETQVFGVW